MPKEVFYPSKVSSESGRRFELSWGVGPVLLEMWTHSPGNGRTVPTLVDMDSSALARLEKAVRRAKRFAIAQEKEEA